MIVMGMVVAVFFVWGLGLVCATRLLRWLPWLMVVVMMWLWRWSHVAGGLRTWRNIGIWIHHHIWIWTLSMNRGSGARIHPLIITMRLGCLRWQGFIIAVWNCSIQTYFLSMIQKVWKCRFLSRILLSCLRSVHSILSCRSWVTSFFSVALLARLWVYSNIGGNWRIITCSCRSILLTLSDRDSPLWNRGHVLSVDTSFVRLWICSLKS
jgi:hypothetical protein